MGIYPTKLLFCLNMDFHTWVATLKYGIFIHIWGIKN